MLGRESPVPFGEIANLSALSTSDDVPIWFVTPTTWDDISATDRRDRDAVRRKRAVSRRNRAGFSCCPTRQEPWQGFCSETVFPQAMTRASSRRESLLPICRMELTDSPTRPRDPSWLPSAFCSGATDSTVSRRTPRRDPAARAAAASTSRRFSESQPRSRFGRDLINTPANVLGPSALEEEVDQASQGFRRTRRTRFEATSCWRRNFPLIHAVGAAAAEPPRLVDFVWGRADAPKVTLVGKGVVFDTGGLDIKPRQRHGIDEEGHGRRRDGARPWPVWSWKHELDIRLRVMIPIVENSISARAMRPGDIIRSRKGLTVEIGNTDAEGRLILADALGIGRRGRAGSLFDFATLTGAARVALGPDLPPFYTDDEALGGRNRATRRGGERPGLAPAAVACL